MEIMLVKNFLRKYNKYGPFREVGSILEMGLFIETDLDRNDKKKNISSHLFDASYSNKWTSYSYPDGEGRKSIRIKYVLNI